MKCLNCGQENRSTIKFCKKCGRDMTAPPIWFPDWKWHLRTLSWIYISVTVLFFAVSYLLRKLPAPYNQRQIPPQMTPWLNPHKVPAP